MHTPESTPTTASPIPNRRRWIIIAFVLAIGAASAVARRSPLFELTDPGVRQLRSNIGDLKAGRTKLLQLSATRNTDALLDQIRGMPEIEELILDDVDITVAGLSKLSDLPNLRRVLSYAGVEGDKGLLALRDCKKLEAVAMFDSSITAEAVAELRQHLPQVRIITSHDGDAPELEPSATRVARPE